MRCGLTLVGDVVGEIVVWLHGAAIELSDCIDEPSSSVAFGVNFVIFGLRVNALRNDVRNHPFFFFLSCAEHRELNEFNEHIESELWWRLIGGLVVDAAAASGEADDTVRMP